MNHKRLREGVMKLMDFSWEGKYIKRDDAVMLFYRFLNIKDTVSVTKFNEQQLRAILDHKDQYVEYIVDAIKARKVLTRSNAHSALDVSSMLNKHYRDHIRNQLP